MWRENIEWLVQSQTSGERERQDLRDGPWFSESTYNTIH